MLRFKGFELKEENVKEDGTEILVSVENKSDMNDEEFEILLWKAIQYDDKLYVENQYDGYFEIRSDTQFTFDKIGVNKLRYAWSSLTNLLKDKAIVNIGVFAGKFVFKGENGKTFNQDDVTIDEFERNLEYL